MVKAGEKQSPHHALSHTNKHKAKKKKKKKKKTNPRKMNSKSTCVSYIVHVGRKMFITTYFVTIKYMINRL